MRMLAALGSILPLSLHVELDLLYRLLDLPRGIFVRLCLVVDVLRYPVVAVEQHLHDCLGSVSAPQHFIDDEPDRARAFAVIAIAAAVADDVVEFVDGWPACFLLIARQTFLFLDLFFAIFGNSSSG